MIWLSFPFDGSHAESTLKDPESLWVAKSVPGYGHTLAVSYRDIWARCTMECIA